MLPRIIQKGVATKEEIDLETLEQRLINERTKANLLYVSDMVFTVWARKPGIGQVNSPSVNDEKVIEPVKGKF